jgi:hypothetical protein
MRVFSMKTKLTIGLVLMAVACVAAALPAEAHIFRHFATCQNCDNGVQDGSVQAGAVDGGSPVAGGVGQGGWQDGYYSAAWGMPMAVVVPPTARWQTDYSWAAGGMRISRIDANFQRQYPGPSSSYQMRSYLPAPPQPSDTRQTGYYNVRAPGK